MFRKQIFFFLTLILLTALTSFSQNDTIKIIDSLGLKKTQYLSPMEYAFMFHEETPWMIKAGIGSDNDYGGNNFIGFERQIKGGLTANVLFGDPFNFSEHRFVSLSARYYYDMKRRNQSRNIPFNLSGNYLEAGFQTNNLEGLRTENRNPTQLLFIKWGMQRRFLKRGFIDVGLKASSNFSSQQPTFNSFNLFSETTLGIAFAKDRTSLNKDKLCSFIKCYESETSVFKLNVSDFFYFGSNEYLTTGFVISPEISHELKLGKYPFSLNNSIRASFLGRFFSERISNRSSLNGFGFALEYLFEGRYYFNLKKRILNGKTGNGLSADYLSLGLFNYYIDGENNFPLESANNFYYLQPQLMIGTQRFVGDHFFYDLGIGFRMPDRIVKQSSFNDNPNDYELIISNRVGFRF